MNEVKVYATEINISDTLDRYAFIRQYLSKDRLYMIDNYHQLDDKLRALKSDWLVRTIMSQITSLSFDILTFRLMKEGKPYLNNVNNLYYNVSHSGKWITLAIGYDEVGIDIEEIKPIDFSVIQHCFSNTEIKNFYNTTQDQQLLYFYDLWTLKESFVKTIGKGILTPLKSFSIEKRTNSVDLQEPTNGTFFFKQFDIDPKYVLSVCSKVNAFANNVEIISF